MFIGHFCDMRTHMPLIFSIQEMRSWVVPSLELLGRVLWTQIWARHVVGFGSVLQELRRFEERSAAVLFETALVMAVYAPDCGKDLEMHDAFISSVSKVLRDVDRYTSHVIFLMHFTRVNVVHTHHTAQDEPSLKVSQCTFHSIFMTSMMSCV